MNSERLEKEIDLLEKWGRKHWSSLLIYLIIIPLLYLSANVLPPVHQLPPGYWFAIWTFLFYVGVTAFITGVLAYIRHVYNATSIIFVVLSLIIHFTMMVGYALWMNITILFYLILVVIAAQALLVIAAKLISDERFWSISWHRAVITVFAMWYFVFIGFS